MDNNLEGWVVVKDDGGSLLLKSPVGRVMRVSTDLSQERTEDGSVLPCPFCGVQPWVGPLHPEIEGNAWATVSCDNRQCLVAPYFNFHGNDTEECPEGLSLVETSNWYKQQAVKLWNEALSSRKNPE